MERLYFNGITHFVLSTGYKSEMIESYFGDNFKSIPTSYAKEAEPLGTGGALINLKKIRGAAPFLVNGDTLFEFDVYSLAETHAKANADVSMLLFRADQNNRYGFVNVNEANIISEIGERQAMRPTSNCRYIYHFR